MRMLLGTIVITNYGSGVVNYGNGRSRNNNDNYSNINSNDNTNDSKNGNNQTAASLGFRAVMMPTGKTTTTT